MKKYRVIKPHTLDYKVGEVVELSESKAKALVNKVELVVEKPAPKAKAKPASKKAVV